MKWQFDENYWREKFHQPNWYILLEKDLEEKIFPIVHKNPEIKTFRHKIYELVEQMLQKNEIPLADKGPNFDSSRKSIDIIVIHHTEEEPDIRISKLSAIGLIRQYGKKYLENDVLGHKLKGQPIWSNHFLSGEMIFCAYHWLVRQDGTAERLLKDKYIGWQSADTDTNNRSIAIALSGDYEENTPPLEQIKGVAKIIREKYPFVPKKRIFGHREIKKGRTCPGSKFLTGWKKVLLDMI